MIQNYIALNRPYVLFVNGREHNVFLEHIDEGYFVGKVALNNSVMLIDKRGAGAVVKIVLSQDEKNPSVIGSGSVIHSEPCVMSSSDLGIRVKIDSVDIIEDPWRKFLPNDVYLQNGEIDADVLCKVFPIFGSYRTSEGNFCSNPDVWEVAKECPSLRIEEDESTSEGVLP